MGIRARTTGLAPGRIGADELAVRRSRRKKPGLRTASGRLSRAGHATRDFGTPQVQRRRLALINGSLDETLSASSIGILYANEVVDQDAYVASLRYARSHAIVFSRLWAGAQSLLGKKLPWQGVEPDEDSHEAAERRLARWNSELTEEQRLAIVAAVASTNSHIGTEPKSSGGVSCPRTRASAGRCLKGSTR